MQNQFGKMIEREEVDYKKAVQNYCTELFKTSEKLINVGKQLINISQDLSRANFPRCDEFTPPIND